MIPSWILILNQGGKNIFSTSLLEHKDNIWVFVPQVSARCFKGNVGSVQLLVQPEAQDTAEDLLNHWKWIKILSYVQTCEGRQWLV